MLTENNTISQKPNNGYSADVMLSTVALHKVVSLGTWRGGLHLMAQLIINMVMCRVQWQRGSCIHGHIYPLGGPGAKMSREDLLDTFKRPSNAVHTGCSWQLNYIFA